MGISNRLWTVDRRTILKSGVAIAAAQFSSPFIIKARGETPVRIGMIDPLTGVYAAIAQGDTPKPQYGSWGVDLTAMATAIASSSTSQTVPTPAPSASMRSSICEANPKTTGSLYVSWFNGSVTLFLPPNVTVLLVPGTMLPA